MLLLSERYESMTFLAIDPGLNNVGIAIYKIQLNPFEFISIEAFTLKADKMVDQSGLDDDDHGERAHKLRTVEYALNAILEREDPCWVVCESPFFDRRKPGSYGVLMEVLSNITRTILNYNPLIRFSMVEPQLVKKVFGVAGIKGKEVVAEAVQKNQVVMSALITPFKDLDDHGIDAVAVGWTHIVKKTTLIEEPS